MAGWGATVIAVSPIRAEDVRQSRQACRCRRVHPLDTGAEIGSVVDSPVLATWSAIHPLSRIGYYDHSPTSEARTTTPLEHILAAQPHRQERPLQSALYPVTNSARVGDADASAETTSAAAPARRDLGAELCPTAAPQHSLIVAVAVHHPDSIEPRAWPCRGLRRCAVCAASLVGDLVA